MGLGILLSGLLHLGLLVLLIFGAPNWRKALPEPPRPIPIDIINITDLSVAPSPKKTKEINKTAQKTQAEPLKEVLPPVEEVTSKIEPPKEESKKEVQPEPETKAVPLPEIKEEIKAEKKSDAEAVPLPEIKPSPSIEKEKKKIEPLPQIPPQKPKKEKKKEVEKEETKTVASPKEKPKKKEQKQKDKPKNKEKKENLFDNILKAVEDLAATEERQPPTGEISEKVQSNEATIIGDTLSISELDALKRQIAQCWSPPSGMENAEAMVVDLQVSLNPDGTVTEAKILDMNRYHSDVQFKPAADAARRAILNPNCNPLKIPLDKYEQLKSFVLKFDPREMF